ncbi:MAG: hypothetical protein Q4D15_06355 [Lachnospiraceae bacterium]|nr:hypothetical protein [Lachnospiraceae bacterium]
MLAEKKLFEIVEEALMKNGSVERFENECGKIKGRMMITVTDIPDGIEVKEKRDKDPIAFEASFDFYDAAVGLALYTKEKELATGIWVTPQKEGAEAPSGDWIEFFIKTLVSNIAEDGSFGYPIYSFVNDTSDMTVVPTAPESE